MRIVVPSYLALVWYGCSPLNAPVTVYSRTSLVSSRKGSKRSSQQEQSGLDQESGQTSESDMGSPFIETDQVNGPPIGGDIDGVDQPVDVGAGATENTAPSGELFPGPVIDPPVRPVVDDELPADDAGNVVGPPTTGTGGDVVEPAADNQPPHIPPLADHPDTEEGQHGHEIDRESAERISTAYEQCIRVPSPRRAPRCVPGTLAVDGERVSFTRMSQGSGSLVYKSTNSRYVLKVVAATSGTTFNGLCMEKAVLGEIVGLEGATVRFHAFSEPAGQLVNCERQTLISDLAPGRSLSVMNPDSHRMRPIAAQLIRALARLHSHGVIHGDVHGRNIIVNQQDGSARLIDFGQASLFIDLQTGEHIPEARRMDSESFSPDLLSVFQLEGFVPTRRDDMVRLAEALLRFPEHIRRLCSLGHPEALEGASMSDTDEVLTARARAYYARCKRRNSQVPNGDRLAQDFYNAMLQLNFAEEPNYEYWAERFLDPALT